MKRPASSLGYPLLRPHSSLTARTPRSCGAGTCLPVCLAALFWRAVGLVDSRIIFVESFCRVQSLSLTGKILYPIADRFVVQWPDLTQRYCRATSLPPLTR